MSKVGKRPIALPEGVQVELQDGRVIVRGPHGALEQAFEPEYVDIVVQGGEVHVTRKADRAVYRSRHGLYRALVANMVHGVHERWQRELELRGLGYRARLEGRTLLMELGYSHPVRYELPEGIEVEVRDNTKVTVTGIDKQLVGQVAAHIRGYRKPEPYRGTGIRYRDEEVARKAGKVGAK